MLGPLTQLLPNMPAPPALGSIDSPSDPQDVDSLVQIVVLCGSPCTDLSVLQGPSRTVYTADPELIFTTHANFNYINVNDPGALSSHDWPSSGITVWFLTEPYDPILTRKKKQYWSTSMVRFLALSRTQSMPLLELIQILPLHPKYRQCSLVKAFQVITGNPQISVLPSLQILHTGRSQRVTLLNHDVMMTYVVMCFMCKA